MSRGSGFGGLVFARRKAMLAIITSFWTVLVGLLMVRVVAPIPPTADWEQRAMMPVVEVAAALKATVLEEVVPPLPSHWGV